LLTRTQGHVKLPTYAITNVQEKPMVDPCGRPVAGPGGNALTESLATYLLALSADARFYEGLKLVESAELARSFVALIEPQKTNATIQLESDLLARVRAVLAAPQNVRFQPALLHCYAEFNDAISQAGLVVEAPAVTAEAAE
jgi:hypothetical protein